MVRVAERLTARVVQTVRAATRPIMLADGKGLYLRVGPSGSKSWIYRYQTGDKTHDLGLGPYPDIPLAPARERAPAQRRLRRTRQDPRRLRGGVPHTARRAAAPASG